MTEMEKQVREALDRGLTAVLIDPNAPNVKLPEFLMPPVNEKPVQLNFSYHFKSFMTTLGTSGICADLSFDGKRCNVYVPWAAILGVHAYDTAVSGTQQKPKPKLTVVK